MSGSRRSSSAIGSSSMRADTEIDDFFCMDSPQYLFASYYAEFSVVSLVAIWWPRIALCYGAGRLSGLPGRVHGARCHGALRASVRDAERSGPLAVAQTQTPVRRHRALRLAPERPVIGIVGLGT